MQQVSRFEANLLTLLYFVLRREPPERALPLIEKTCTQPPCLSPGAVRLVQVALAKGCAYLLGSRGGWREERYLRGDQPRTGRLWERTSPAELGLSFSPHTLDFLIALTALRPGAEDWTWQPPEANLTDGDRLLLFFAHEGLRECQGKVGELRRRPPFATHGLCWLALPEDFAGQPEGVTPSFAAWTTGVGACIVEALQPDLARRWEQVEGGKERITNPRLMRALGDTQERVLTAFLDAVGAAGRWDLARFLLRALMRLLGPHAHAGMWTAGLNTTGLRLADRAAVYQASFALLRQLPRLHDWTRRARAASWLDEGYAAAQMWKADWEQCEGDVLVERAANLVRQLDPMRQG